MNPTTWTIYREYLNQVGEPSAAAALTLADAMQSSARLESPQQPMTVPEVAKFLRVRPNKVLSWIRSGCLRGYNITERENGRPKYRINPSDLEAFTQQRAITQAAPKGRPAGRRRIPQPKWQPK
jgi:excisionase family DNA binding protein